MRRQAQWNHTPLMGCPDKCVRKPERVEQVAVGNSLLDTGGVKIKLQMIYRSDSSLHLHNLFSFLVFFFILTEIFTKSTKSSNSFSQDGGIVLQEIHFYILSSLPYLFSKIFFFNMESFAWNSLSLPPSLTNTFSISRNKLLKMRSADHTLKYTTPECHPWLLVHHLKYIQETQRDALLPA